MKPDKVAKFCPGQEFRLDKRVIFVEYESMTGEFVKCRFDLSQKTEMIYNDHRILSYDDLVYLYSGDEEIFIKKVEYYEQECHLVIGDNLLIPTKVYFENAGYQQAYEINSELLRNVANSAYGMVSRDWADVLTDSARYIHMQRSRCSGKTLWLSSATSFADKQWLKEPPTPYELIADDLEDCEKGVPNMKLGFSSIGQLYIQNTTTGEVTRFDGVKNFTQIDPNGYFDTDMVMTKEEMQYCLNDVAVTEKLFKEEKVMRFNSCKPTIKNVIFNNPATIVMWSDGTKTVVKCGENDDFDPEKGIAMCCMKKLLGTNKTGSNYLDKVEKYFDKYVGDCIEECQTIGEILGSIFKPTKKQTDIPPEVTVEKEFEAVTCNEDQVAEENGE